MPLSLGLHSENEGCMYLLNVSVITQKTKILILTIIKTSNISCANIVFGSH
jgi:hypothetical protein